MLSRYPLMESRARTPDVPSRVGKARPTNSQPPRSCEDSRSFASLLLDHNGVRPSKHAAAPRVSSVTEKLRWPSVGAQELIHHQLDTARICRVPMSEAMQRALLAGEGVERQNSRNRMQGGRVKGLAVARLWPAIHRHEVPPHV